MVLLKRSARARSRAHRPAAIVVTAESNSMSAASVGRMQRVPTFAEVGNLTLRALHRLLCLPLLRRRVSAAHLHSATLAPLITTAAPAQLPHRRAVRAAAIHDGRSRRRRRCRRRSGRARIHRLRRTCGRRHRRWLGVAAGAAGDGAGARPPASAPPVSVTGGHFATGTGAGRDVARGGGAAVLARAPLASWWGHRQGTRPPVCSTTAPERAPPPPQAGAAPAHSEASHCRRCAHSIGGAVTGIVATCAAAPAAGAGGGVGAEGCLGA